jgi:hypothetical protein
MEGCHMSYMKSSASTKRGGQLTALWSGLYQGTSLAIPSRALTNSVILSEVVVREADDNAVEGPRVTWDSPIRLHLGNAFAGRGSHRRRMGPSTP